MSPGACLYVCLSVCRSLMTDQMLWQFNEFVQQSMDHLVTDLNAMELTTDYTARCVGVPMWAWHMRCVAAVR